jgi:hypothetical protein
MAPGRNDRLADNLNDTEKRRLASRFSELRLALTVATDEGTVAE